MITDTNKKYFTGFALFFLFLHFTATFFYVAPNSITGKTLKAYSGYYILPLFHQGWTLFAPSPPMVNKKVYVTAETKTGNKFEDEFFSRQKMWHNRVRMGVSGRVVMLMGNALHSVYATWNYLEENEKSHVNRISQFRRSTTGKLFENLVYRWIQMEHPDWLINGEIVVTVNMKFENYQNFISSGKVQNSHFTITYRFAS